MIHEERAHTQATESVSGHSFGRFGGFPGEKTGTHDGRSNSPSCMGVDSQRPGSAATLAGHFFFHGTRAQGWHGEHAPAGSAVRCGTTRTAASRRRQ